MIEYTSSCASEPSTNSDRHREGDRMQDWRQAIQLPTAYRIGNSTVRLQYHFVIGVITLGFIALIVFYNSASHAGPPNRYALEKRSPFKSFDHLHTHNQPAYNDFPLSSYNVTYPLTVPVRTENGIRYRIGIITDLDTGSKKGNEWVSYLKSGSLIVDNEYKKVTVEWEKDDPVMLKTALASGGWGMELSELVVFNGNLLSFDDRTGAIYQLENKNSYPWVLLPDGPGKVSKGFKSEWATVKDRFLYVGGLGKAWTTPTGELVNYHPQYIKKVSPSGEVTHIDWHLRYESLARAAGIVSPGYLIHESAAWSQVHKRWVFMPRRESKERYDDVLDESRGSNLMLLADEEFDQIETRRIGEVVPTHGFSSFKFIPNSLDNLIVALKSEETKGVTASYIMAFNFDGTILLPETKIDGDYKYEGIEFI